MKRYFLPICFSILLAACSPRGSVVVRFEGLSNDTVLLTRSTYADHVLGEQKPQKDTLVLSDDGVCRMKLETEQPLILTWRPLQYHIDYQGRRISNEAGALNVILDKGDKITIEARCDEEALTARIEGSQLNADIAQVENASRKLFAQYMAAIVSLGAADEAQAAALRKRIGDLRGQIEQVRTDFIEAHPDREASAYLFLQIGGKEAVAYYDKVDKSIFAGTFRPVEQKFLRHIETVRLREEAAGRVVEGAEAPDFTLADLEGKPLSLSSLRGKWVVIDFWGSWCGWCIKGIPEMKEHYARHAGKFEVLGVACNDSDERWRKAVAEHELPWLNVINPMEAEPAESVSVLYAVQGYPTKIIVDPKGIIHKIFRGEGPDFYRELDRVLQ